MREVFGESLEIFFLLFLNDCLFYIFDIANAIFRKV